jgi:hypothetical protein
MLEALLSKARQLVNRLRHPPAPRRLSASSPHRVPALAPGRYHPLERVLLTDGVGRTLFEEYASHRSASRGEEETGWVLLGLREPSQAIVLGTLPAGAEYEASAAHVRFNSTGQAVASRIVRQADRRLTILGVVHTHPGSLRHPSDGDYRGDVQWVRHLRGGEGVFGIGTADGPAAEPGASFAQQPRPHVQCWGELRFSWYALRHGEGGYRPLPVDLTIGPDLARPLHSIWPALEAHAERIERLILQQAGLRFSVEADERGPGLVMTMPLAEPGNAIRVLIKQKEVRYFLERGEELLAVDHFDDLVDRGLYLLLAELAART